jgi:DNA-directed RNA polymerase specialized sigma24 family protein
MDEKKKAERWAKRHGFDVDLDAPRLPSGESARPERSDWLENSGGKIVNTGRFDDDDQAQDALNPSVLWNPGRTPGQEKLTNLVESILEGMRPQDVALLHDRYFERKTLTDMAKARKCSYQAVQSALRTAEQNFKREVARHG